jgi:2,4-dienoyl-CoA reductase-like NADH-dependent reductase (Old Yellow Enzyme family)
MLQFFSASTSVVNSKRAITECLENALEGESDLNCDLIIIYTAMGHNFKELLSEAHRLSPGAQIAGCTCAGVIGREGPDESIKALAIMAIKGPKNEFAISGRAFPENTDSYGASLEMATELKNNAPDINMIFFHPSYRLMPYDRAIKGIESVFGPEIPIVGGVSIDNMKLVSSFQFIGEKIFEMGAIMIGFADPAVEVISQANHGFDIIGKPFNVTSSDGNHIFELDGKPAWKSWTERLGMPETTQAPEVLVFAPLAIELEETFHEEYGSKFLIYGALPDRDRSVFGAITFPEGKKLWLTRRNEKGIHEGVERMMVQILERCDGRKPVAVFHADCAARGNLLLNRIVKEEIIGQMQYPLCREENVPWLGMYGGAEFTPLGGKNQLHGYTTSLYVIVKHKAAVKEEKVQLHTEAVKSSKLFKPAVIKNISLKNRFVCSATWSGKARFNGACSPILINSVLDVAKGDPGLIISEMTYVSQNGQCAPLQMGVYDDTLLPGLNLLVENVHRHGVPVIMQLVHGGLFTVPLLTGTEPMGPSVLETPDGPLGREMTREEIREIIVAFRDGAIRAQKAGFDGVQVHAAHGWLLSQFLSPFFNKRTDEYGGTLENRARIVLEVTKSIREAVGDNFALTIKINSDDLLPGGFNTDDMIQVSEMLEKAGVDAIEISGGTIGALLTGNVDGSFSPVSRKDVYYMEAAKRLKEKIKIPVMLVGGIRTFETADELVKSGAADYISLCRPLIREPDLIKKWKSGNLKKSDCISDSACFQPGMEGKGVHCVHMKNE